MNRSAILATIIFIASSSCKKNLNTDAQLPLVPGKNQLIKNGENRKLYDSESYLAMDSVVNDSRCPEDLVCVWEGNAVVKFVYSTYGNKTTFKLNTHSQLQNDTLINGVRIKLVNLHPYPKGHTPVSQEKYKAELLITRQ